MSVVKAKKEKEKKSAAVTYLNLADELKIYIFQWALQPSVAEID